jgi:hypothetical protein
VLTAQLIGNCTQWPVENGSSVIFDFQVNTVNADILGDMTSDELKIALNNG